MKFSKNYDVHSFECDFNRKLRVAALLRFFEDIALAQSEERGVGLKYYHENNVAWMLNKWELDIKRMPDLGEKINIVTDPNALHKFFANRNYEVFDSKGEVIVSARSLWLYVNILSKRPMKISDEMYSAYGLEREASGEYEKLSSLPELKEPESFKKFSVRESDIDFNEHVNNSKYVEWAIETMPEKLRRFGTLKKLNVNYMKETNAGEEIVCRFGYEFQDDNALCLNSLSSGQNEVCRVETEWAPMK